MRESGGAVCVESDTSWDGEDQQDLVCQEDTIPEGCAQSMQAWLAGDKGSTQCHVRNIYSQVGRDGEAVSALAEQAQGLSSDSKNSRKNLGQSPQCRVGWVQEGHQACCLLVSILFQ